MRTLQVQWIALLGGLILVTTAASSRAQTAEDHDPLLFLERLVGGEWHGLGQYQVYEWGVGRLCVRSRAYVEEDGEPRLVSEGMIYHHPGEQQVVGQFVAVGMGIDLFDYRLEFEVDRMIGDLRTYGQLTGRYQEVWEFLDDDRYEWSLYHETDEGEEKVMGGVFERRRR